MIATLLIAVLTGPQIVELPEAAAPFITVQAIIHTGTLDGRERALAQVICDTVLDATDGYNKYKLLQYSTLAGVAPQCSLSADHFRIQVEVPRGQIALAADLTGEILRHSRFEGETVVDDLAGAFNRSPGFMAEAIQPWDIKFEKIKPSDVRAFYVRTFTPESVTIGVGGCFKAGEAKSEFQKQFSDWLAPKVRQPEPSREPPEILGRHSFPVSTLEIYGSQFVASDEVFPAQLLAATALGVGKWSSLHRILREKMGVSYRQEAAVTPTPLGFQTRLFIFAAPSDHETGFAEEAKRALATDVAAWSEEDRLRAQGMAEAFLEAESPLSPLYFDGARPVGSSLEDRTFLQGYWVDKAGIAWDPRHLLAKMNEIKLDELKKIALELLNTSQSRLISGIR